MKYVVLLCDGMADTPVPALNGKTPMEAAYKPNMDKLAAVSEIGLAKTVDDSMKPGSDVANLSVLGYDPKECYAGRSPLEAASIGIAMRDTDVSLRCNLVTLSDEPEYSKKTMLDYCADDISTAEASVLIQFIQENLGSQSFTFYPGVSYRHCLIWANGTLDVGTLTPPHDISDKRITDYLAVNANGQALLDLMEQSYALLQNHPLNLERTKHGKRPANSIWLWGEGIAKPLQSFEEKYHKTGVMISAVDLLKGIGKLTGMETPDIPGATGYLDTNFSGKANAAIDHLKNGVDFAYLHIEAPDECGHRGEIEHKVASIEQIDKEILAPVLAAFADEEIRILICPDHPTPLALRTHTNDPVPFLLYDSRKTLGTHAAFTEKNAKESGLYLPQGFTLMERFLDAQ